MTGNTFFFSWEVPLIQAIQSFGGGIGEKLAVFFSLFGEDAVMMLVIGIFYWGFNKQWGKFISLNFIAASMGGSMLKNIARRRRPYMDHPEIRGLMSPTEADADMHDVLEQGFSFPSLHSVDSMTIYGTLANLFGKLWIRVLCGLLILAVGVSRVAVGVHYPTDVLAGWAIGLLFMVGMSKIQRRFANPEKLAIILLLVLLPGWFFCVSTDYYSLYGLLLGMTASYMFEERVVRFENTRSVPHAIARTLGGIAVFFVLSELLKLPFSPELLGSVTLTAHLIRVLRYAFSIFMAMGVYPMCFKYMDRIGRKRA